MFMQQASSCCMCSGNSIVLVCTLLSSLSHHRDTEGYSCLVHFNSVMWQLTLRGVGERTFGEIEGQKSIIHLWWNSELEEHSRGHFIILCSVERHSGGHFLMFYLSKAPTSWFKTWMSDWMEMFFPFPRLLCSASILTVNNLTTEISATRD